MSTRSSIAVERANGSVSAVYCHFDGYLDGVGAALISGYASQEEAEALVALGDLRMVSRRDGVFAYHRDRGEPWEDVAPKNYRDRDAYLANVGEDIADNGYRYLFAGGAWWVWGPRKKLVEVRDAIAAEKAKVASNG